MASPSDRDRYFTSDEILALVAEQWPHGIDLDPCWDGLSAVQAERCYDIRADQDGLALPWQGKVWLNPPYSRPAPWLARAAQHQLDGGETLALVPAAVGSDYWRIHVWPFASVCFLNPRPKFSSLHAGSSCHLRDCAVLHFGEDRDRFAQIWENRGEVVPAREWRPPMRPGRGVNLSRKP